MDGTGDLFERFQRELPVDFSATVIRYSGEESQSWEQLEQLAKDAIPASEPFALVAESFSGPIAYSLAVDPPPNLKALILCASFLTNPAPAILSWLRPVLSQLMFRLPLPDAMVRRFLLGPDASDDQVRLTKAAIAKVSPAVLAHRAKLITDLEFIAFPALDELPTLYLQAEKDELVSARCFDEIAALAPQMERETVDAPHLILQRQPRKSMTLIRAFLNQHGE
jgi:pimeloyl-ACP methyl ester carboxylesterase